MKILFFKSFLILLVFAKACPSFTQITYDYYRNPEKIGSPNPVATAYLIKSFEFIMQWGAEDTDSAIVYLQKAISEDKNYAMAYATLGHLLRYKGYNGATVNMDSVQRLAEKAVKLNPKLGDANTLFARVCDFKGEHNKAIEACLKAVEFEPDHRETWLWLGVMYSRTPGKTDSAIYAFNKCIEVAPNFGQPHQKLGLIYMNDQPDYKKAAYHFRQMVRLYEDYKPRDERMILGYCGLGEALLLDKKIDPAIDTLNLLLKICDNKPVLWVDNLHARVHSTLMMCYMEKARTELSQLIDGNLALQSKDPKNTGVSSQIIYEYDDLSHKLKAFSFIDTLNLQKVGQYEIVLNNSPTDNNLATVINSKVFSMMDEKDYQGAISELNSYLVKYPDKKNLKVDIYYNMACNYAQLNQPKTALKYLGLSIQEGFNDLEWIKIDPNLSSLSDDPEFKRIISH